MLKTFDIAQSYRHCAHYGKTSVRRCTHVRHPIPQGQASWLLGRKVTTIHHKRKVLQTTRLRNSLHIAEHLNSITINTPSISLTHHRKINAENHPSRKICHIYPIIILFPVLFIIDIHNQCKSGERETKVFTACCNSKYDVTAPSGAWYASHGHYCNPQGLRYLQWLHCG